MRQLRARVAASIPLTVTSAERSPEEQASAMLAKALRKDAGSSAWSDDLLQLYRSNANYVQQLLNSGRNVSTWAQLIRGWTAQGVYLSRHLRGDALDLRRSEWTDLQLATVKAAAEALGAKAVVESDHLHLERIGTATAVVVSAAQNWWTWGAIGVAGIIGLKLFYRRK